MTRTTPLPAVFTRSDPARPLPTASIFLPKEHGSWSIALEPVALGVLAAPSLAGSALACAFVAGFLARRPFKIVSAGGSALRQRTTASALVLLGGLSAGGLLEAALLGPPKALWPLALMAPPALMFLYLDWRREARAVAAEIAGATAFAVAPVTLGTLAGWPVANALPLAAVMLARSLPTIMTVRFCLRQAKGRAQVPWAGVLPVLAALVAFLALAMLASGRLVPAVAPLLALAFVGRAIFHALPRRPAWTARRVGVTEAILGGLYVMIIALAWSHR